MSLFGWISGALKLGLGLWGWVRGQDSKPTLTDLLPVIMSNLLPAVEKAIGYQGLDTQEKFDSWLEALDAGTGSDPTAVDLIRDLPPDQEELLFDHLKEAARIYGYCLIKVPGYHQA